MPPALVAQPDLPDHLQFPWRAFWDLCGDRALGFGTVGPIPWTAIDRYAARLGITDNDEFERLARLVRAMDGEWREQTRKPSP